MVWASELEVNRMLGAWQVIIMAFTCGQCGYRNTQVPTLNLKP